MNDHALSFLCGVAAGLMLKSLCNVMAHRPATATSQPHIRNAGRREMQDPPRDWDAVDEQLDESFPASDPPGNY